MLAGMAARTYGQYCAITTALDLIGERWSLLVVRELLDGPKRYTDLLAGLTGIATDMLATRLRDLEAAGVVTRRTLPPPAGSKVYELTPLGQDLRPMMIEMVRWGLRLLGEPGTGMAFQPHGLSLWLHAMFHADRAHGAGLTAQFDVDGTSMHARIADGSIETGSGPADHPDVIIRSDAATLARVARDPDAAVDPGRIQITGSTDNVARLLSVLGIQPPRKASRRAAANPAIAPPGR